MKKHKSDLGIKNSILIIVSALSLAFATFSWFSLNNHNNIENFEAEVDTLSSNFTFYQAVDENRNGVIDGSETYVEISDNSINTRYMIPGEKYFYKAILNNRRNNSHFAFIFSDIVDDSSFSSEVKVTARLLDSTNVTVAQTSTERSIDYFAVTDENSIKDATVLTAQSLPAGDYSLFYTLKIDENTGSDFENDSLLITNVVTAFFVS